MIYSRTELNTKGVIDPHVAVQRYLYKFLNQRKEIQSLKWHEKYFFYEHLQILEDGKGRRGFDIYTIPEAWEYVLYRLILIYASGNTCIDFSKKAVDYYGIISSSEKSKHKAVFWKLLKKWTEQLNEGKGQYLMVIKPLYENKHRELEELQKQKRIDARTYIQKDIYMRATFYHVYYTVRKYFDEKKIKAEALNLDSIDFYSDIYTYAHILTRHYYPNMNDAVGGSLNDNIGLLNLWELPVSILELVKKYSQKCKITRETEYLLFIIDNVRYILWLKFGKIALLNNIEGMEIRSFYRCEEQRDIYKYENKTIEKIDNHLSVVF